MTTTRTSSPPDTTTRAVRWILDAPAFVDHQDLFAVHSGPAGMTGQPWWDFPAILEAWMWSGGEDIALRAAEALYRHMQFPTSKELMRLDGELRDRVLQAQRIALGMDRGDVGEDLVHACVICRQTDGTKEQLSTLEDGRKLFAHPRCIEDGEAA